MPGLAGVDDRTFVGAMQQINDAILNPLFFATFLGAFVLTGAAVYLQRRLGPRQATPWILAALIPYGLGSQTTMAFNEPLNIDLADAGDPGRIADPAGVRDAFKDKWVARHIIRTVLSSAALSCLAYALRLHGRAERGPAQRKAGAGESPARRRGAAADAPLGEHQPDDQPTGNGSVSGVTPHARIHVKRGVRGQCAQTPALDDLQARGSNARRRSLRPGRSSSVRTYAADQ